MNHYGISVLLCCYNSSSRLGDTLRHLANQQIDKSISWEVILIDNNSSDDTVKIAQSLWDKCKVDVPLIITTEYKPGVMHARNKGLNLAHFEFCLFCDDDNWLNHNYVQNVYDIMISNPQVGVLGGLSEAVHEGDQIPGWFEKHQSYYAVGPQHRLVLRYGFVYGAGSVFRRSVYLKIHGEKSYKHLFTGKKKNLVAAGEDVELCYNYTLRGYDILYSENLKFKHFIRRDRVTDDYFKKLINVSCDCWIIFKLYQYRIDHSLNSKFLWWKVLFISIILALKAVKINFTTPLQRPWGSLFYIFTLIINRKQFAESLAYLRKKKQPNYYMENNS